MTYFLIVTLPLIMGAALIGAWLSILPFVLVAAALIFSATWLFG